MLSLVHVSVFSHIGAHSHIGPGPIHKYTSFGECVSCTAVGVALHLTSERRTLHVENLQIM